MTVEERPFLALLSEEPAGRISTRSAGAVSFKATLSWHPDDGMLTEPALAEPAPDSVRFSSLVHTQDAASATRRVSCEIRAFHAEHLAHAVDAALRSVTTHATLTEAVLETLVVRLANPTIVLGTLLEDLAWQLWSAGFPVSFGPSWEPAPGADISLGIRGFEDSLETFLREHPGWQTLPRSR